MKNLCSKKLSTQQSQMIIFFCNSYSITVVVHYCKNKKPLLLLREKYSSKENEDKSCLELPNYFAVKSPLKSLKSSETKGFNNLQQARSHRFHRQVFI